MLQWNDDHPNVGASTRQRGDSQNTVAEPGSVLNQDAESDEQSIPELLPYSNNDWRPAFDKRLPGLLYSSEALRSLRSDSNVIKMGEAYHECTRGLLDPQDMHNTTSIGKGYYMKAMTPRADFEMDLDDSPENPQEEDSRRHVSPNPGQLDEMARAVLRSGSPLPHDSVSGYEAGDSDASTLTPETDAAFRASEREYDDLSEAEQQQEGEDEAGRLSTNPLGSLADLRQSVSGPAGSEETTSGLDETTPELEGTNSILEETKPELEDNKSGLANGDDEGEEAKLAEPCLKKPPVSSLPEPIPLSDGTRGGPPTKERSSGLETAQRHLEHIATRFKSIVLDPARHGRPITAAEKGKWRAECECSECQPQRRERARFDWSAMDTAVKMMMENRRVVEEDPRGEGCSSWATAGPAELAWPCMFTNPRPAPQMPVLVPGCKRERSLTVVRREGARKKRVDKRDIGEPMEQQDRDVEALARHSSLFPLAVALPSSGPTAGGQTTSPLALQRTTHGTIRRKAWRTLSKRLKEVRDSPRWIPRVAAE